MTEAAVRQALDEEMEATRVVDPHCHLDPSRPAAGSLADVVLYHHVWIEMVSAGMGIHEVTSAGLPHELVDPGMDPEERVRRALPWLPRIRTTAVGVMLRRLVEDLYDFHDPLDASSLPRLERAFHTRASDPGWTEELLGRRCGIDRSITVEGAGKPALPRMLRASEALGVVNIEDGKRDPMKVLADWDRELGRPVRRAGDLEALIRARLRGLPLEELRFLGAWVHAGMTPLYATDREVSRILARARRGLPLSRDGAGSVTYWGMRTALEHLRSTPLRTIQLITGAEVRPPHRSLTAWSPSFPGALARLAGEFEDFHFNTSTAAEAHVQDLAVLAKHFPNISVAGYWWHTFYPSAIRASLERRLDTVPVEKIVGFFSDAYSAEWCWPKLWLVKRVLADHLADRVSRGWHTLGDARHIVRTILGEAPRRIYDAPEG